MKKLISLLILFSIIFAEKEAFALTAKEAAKMDLTAPCGLSEEALEKGLKGKLSGLAPDFLAAEEEHGVNAVFLAAVAALESGWGKSCFRPNNIFGWSGKSFDSVQECIDFVASKIAGHYLAEDGKYYHGKTVSGVNICYNGNDFWPKKISGIMAMIVKNSESEAASLEKSPQFTVVFVG